MSYYLEDHPNTELAQYGWPRAKVSGVIGVHTTESGVFPAGSDPGAENTARYISVRTNHGSYHALADWDSRIKLVRPRYAAWADITNNAHAMSVSGAMNAARWRDLTPERAAGIVRNMAIAAAELVQDAIADGRLDSPTPARRITAQQAIDGSVPGFYGHGETNPGTRYDPGANFDWDLFLATYANAIGGGINFQSTTTEPKEWDEMASKEEIKDALREVAKEGPAGRDLGWFNWFETALPGWNGNVSAAARVAGMDEAMNESRALLTGLAAEVAGLRGALAAATTNPSITPESLTAAFKEAVGEFSITLSNKESK